MASINLNKVILIGRMTADPELRQTQSGIPVTSFNIAVNRRHQKDKEQEADFISIVAWRQTAEFISKYFHKGSSICILGSIQTRNYTTDSGDKRYVTEVLADEARFVDSKSEGGTASTPTPEYTSAPEYAPVSAQFEELPNDEDLPF